MKLEVGDDRLSEDTRNNGTVDERANQARKTQRSLQALRTMGGPLKSLAR